ncbi:MAG: hypothetical protein AAGC81_19810 [Pseudomonadota bacterium]
MPRKHRNTPCEKERAARLKNPPLTRAQLQAKVEAMLLHHARTLGKDELLRRLKERGFTDDELADFQNEKGPARTGEQGLKPKSRRL